ncbi:Alpha/Beta hydrolase protein, partial [Mycena vulgaris]
MSQYSHLSAPDPEFMEVWSKLPPSPPGPIDLATQRHAIKNILVPQIMEGFRPQLPADTAYRVVNRTIPVDGGEIAIRCIQPTPQEGEDAEFPVLVWIHGGGWHRIITVDSHSPRSTGWVLGDLDMDDFHLRILSVEFRLSIVNVDYRLAPEYPFPTGLNDSYAALKWAVDNAPEISGSFKKGLLLGGTSAGAHYTTVIAHRARDDPFFEAFPLTGQILQIPVLLHPAAYPEQYAS